MPHPPLIPPAAAAQTSSTPAESTAATRPDAAYFDAPICRNCAAPLQAAYCSACGQKKARRFAWRDLAREYVLGMRKRHMHPLKLLVVMVALLVLALNRNRFFAYFSWSDRADAQIDRMAALVQGYANWSFSLGILAIWMGSYLVYRRRLGYNAIEHAVLAVYCQILIIAVILINFLPTLFWNTPDFVRDYKAASATYLYVAKVFIVAIAYRQFLLVDLRREWLRLLVAVSTYMVTSWVLLRLYAALVLAIVQAQLT